MLNFPVPYPDELVYSIVARAGIHMGIASPKQLLDEVFNDRKVIATVDLPSHLKSISSNYPASLELTVSRLAYQNTLFPIYAPFVSEETRRRCLHWMEELSHGAIHLALGVTASRIKQKRNLYYCPKCMEMQLVQYGEYYWDRKWQITGSDCCIDHGKLVDASVERHNYHRHYFDALHPKRYKSVVQSRSTEEEQRVTRQVNELLALTPARSPSFEQWSAFYKTLARDLNYTRGKFVKFDAIKDKYISHFTPEWLIAHELMPNNDQTCWLRSIFRKHRKSFSYLEHVTVLDTLISAEWHIEDVIKDVLSLRVDHKQLENKHSTDANAKAVSQEKRDQWEKYLKKYGVKQSRNCGGNGLYAWLYRHDRDWLLLINSRHKKPVKMKNFRVDWNKRDRHAVKQLFALRNLSTHRVDLPRQSKNWYLSQISRSSTIIKNLDRLPLVTLFLLTYSEDVATYQVRRILRAIEHLKARSIIAKRWRILRIAGLNDRTLTEKAAQILKKAIMD